jgi:hypothetical protein
MERTQDSFDRRHFYDSCNRLREFIENLELRLMECEFARRTNTSIPHEIVSVFMKQVNSYCREDADGYVSIWQNHIAGSESDASAIAAFEFPQITIDKEIATPILSISPTAHGYAAHLLSFLYWDCWGAYWDKPREGIIVEATKRLMSLRFVDCSTLSRVEARMAREQAKFETGNDIKLTGQKQKRLMRADKKVLALSILIFHHRPFGDWNQTPLELDNLVKLGLKSQPTASRAMKELFGKRPMDSYKKMIHRKTLQSFLQRSGEISPLRHLSLVDKIIADPAASSADNNDLFDE